MNQNDDKIIKESETTVENPQLLNSEDVLCSEIVTDNDDTIHAIPINLQIPVNTNQDAESQESTVLLPSCVPIVEPVHSDLSFLVSEDSVSLSEVHFEPLPHFPDDSVVSPSFSRNRQLICDDSLDSASRDGGSLTPSALQQCGPQDDFFLSTAEETSMDSGLGSVESAYNNSEEENVLSPEEGQSSSARIETSNQSVTTVETVEVGGDLNTSDIYYDCLTVQTPKPNLKRDHDYDVSAQDQPNRKKLKRNKKVGFEKVTVFYFPRKQGFVSVPSQGGSTLGMAMGHNDAATMSIHEHHQDTIQRHKEKVREHWREQKIEDKIKQLKFINPELDNGTLSTMAQTAISQADNGATTTRNDDAMLDNFDDFFFLQPISAKKRRKILRLAGVDRIDGEEKLMNRILRESREMCGCDCDEVCLPSTCECALSGIQCQVDRESFPCGCLSSGCQNKNGRVEFDVDRVRTHLVATLEKLRAQEEDTDSQLESVASSEESECDVMSSDAEQSDNEGLKEQGAETENVAQTVEIVEISQIPQNFLRTLGLQKVNVETVPNEEITVKDLHVESIPSGIVGGFLNDPVNETYNEFPYKSIESLAQSIPDPPPQSLPRSMFGTTSPTTYCQGAPTNTDRDMSISLDPIATFMSANYNVTNETIVCSSNC